MRPPSDSDNGSIPWKIIVAVVILLLVVLSLALAIVSRLIGLSYGDTFSLGQFILDLILLPTVIIGFFIAVHEFRKTQHTPDMDILWETEPGKYHKVLVIDAQQYKQQGARPVIVNSGKSVALWYIIQFDVPTKLITDIGGNLDGLALARRWVFHAGDQENWRVDLLEKHIRIVFTSNGKIASYPGYPLPLGILDLTPTNYEDKEQWYDISFNIMTEIGQPRNKKPLLISLRDKLQNRT
jgi:hypothetical protein